MLHAHLPHAAWLARWSRLAAHVPVVVDTLHSSSTGGMGRRIGYACSRFLPDHVTAVSHATATAHVAAGMASARRLSIVDNAVDVKKWRPDTRNRLAVRGELRLRDEFLWIAVGRLEKVKDYPTLLRALKCTSAPARLVILGTGPLETELVRLAARLGIEKRVRFQGHVPNVRRWMQAADGIVLSSRYEGLPMVLLEAGACGLPAVATDVAGTQEVIVDGLNGWLARAGDADALAHEMNCLMEMPAEERCDMGECARRLVAWRFSMESVMDQWERLYDDLLSKKRGAWRSRRQPDESFNRQSAASA